MKEKRRPKCKVCSFSCSNECDYDGPDADEFLENLDCGNPDCINYDTYFTPAEQLSALMDKAKELPKEIVVPALRAALEELTNMRWVMIDKPKGVSKWKTMATSRRMKTSASPSTTAMRPIGCNADSGYRHKQHIPMSRCPIKRRGGVYIKTRGTARAPMR